MGIRVTLNTHRLDMLIREVPNRADEKIGELAMMAMSEAGQLMSGAKSGILYGTHQASAPGEAPAVDTGTLKNNMHVGTGS